MNASTSILVGCDGPTVCVKVNGKGSFQNSGGLRDFAREMMERGHRVFRIDLSACPVMDSTFMGTLAGIALKLREVGEGGIRVVLANERNRDLLQNLGLDQLLTVDADDAKAGEESASRQVLSAPQPDKVAQAETMLEAHEALVEAAPANIVKFKDVLDYLRQDLGRDH